MKKLILLLPLLFVGFTFGQSNINPNVSLVGTFNTFTNFIDGSPEKGKLNFEDPALEMFIDGYLNPYAKATADIAYHDGEFEVEELYANILRGLPLDVQIKAGKYLLGFGKINTVHEHAWSFLERPLSHQIYFGEEGLNDIGINLSFILPTEDFYSNFDIGIYKGDSFRGTGHGHGEEEEHGEEEQEEEEHEEEFELGTVNSPVVVGRLGTFFSLSDLSNIELGLSGAYGVLGKLEFHHEEDEVHNPISENITFTYAGFDFKYKYKPNSYTSLTIQGEGILNNRKVFRETEGITNINTFGGFLYFDYQFSKVFSIGAKYDITYGIIGDEPSFNTVANDDINKTNGISGWIGYYPVEETLALRFGVEHLTFSYENGTERDGETKLKLQMIFSLGPHKAHPF